MLRDIRLMIMTLAICSCACAANITASVPLKYIMHPKASFRASGKSLDMMIVSAAVLQSINIGDYATTHRAFTGADAGKYCENNPLLVSAPCVIDLPRFTGVKIVVAAAGLAELIPVFMRRDTPTYRFAVTVVNFGASIPLGIAVVGNIHALEK